MIPVDELDDFNIGRSYFTVWSALIEHWIKSVSLTNSCMFCQQESSGYRGRMQKAEGGDIEWLVLC